MVEASISISSDDSSGTSVLCLAADVGEAAADLGLRWRATNSNDACDGSIAQVPTSGPGGR
jgi:hypothetical protein